jgi:hypothetical protein
MDQTLPETVSAETPPALFWAASKFFALHCLLTILGILWAITTGQPLLALLFAVLWALAFALWLEWRNA